MIESTSNVFVGQTNDLPTLFVARSQITTVAAFVGLVVMPQSRAAEIETKSLVKRVGVEGALFERLDPAVTGVDMVHPIDPEHPRDYLYDSGFAAGGVTLGDFDGDGRIDLFIAGGPIENRLYRQLETDDGTIRFEDITKSAGVAGEGEWSSGTAAVDLEGDGDLDLVVCSYDAPNRVFVNDGKAVFTDNGLKSGLGVTEASLFPAFADYDNDGDLDCYLLTHQFYDPDGLPKDLPAKLAGGQMRLNPGYERYYRLMQAGPGKHAIKSYGRPDYLFRNDGGGRFTDVTLESGISGDGLGLSVSWCDFDEDGRQDVYVANDGDGPDRMYRNLGDGSFKEVAAETLPHTSWFSMGSDVGDLDNDGRFDLFVADMSSTNHYRQKTTMGAMNAARLLRVAGPPPQVMRNALLLNTATGRFREAAFLAGLGSSDWSWAPKIADFDCDGRQDVFISNGVSRNFTNSDLAVPEGGKFGRTYWECFEDQPPFPQQNRAFRNLGDLKFKDQANEWGLDHEGMSYATAYGDLDNDGDLDLVVVNLDEAVSIYRNQGEGGHRVALRLIGRGGNSHGIGARVVLRAAAGSQVRQINPMTGFLSCNDPRLHFGLGEDEKVEELKVIWPSGTVQTFTDLAADHHYAITEPGEPSKAEDAQVNSEQESIYQPHDLVASIRHYENEFDDFSKQPLLPNKLSQLGPGLVIADFNGDGAEDVFLSGAAGTAAYVGLRENGKLSWLDGDALFEHHMSEDMGACALDADRDGDLDLFVASGGYEFEAGAEELRDRLYINDGKGVFKHAPEGALPDLRNSAGCVAACDFDRDGDLDIFVGGRVIPGRYPLSPNSVLLRNDGTSDAPKFTEVAEECAPGLRESGLVTGALWSDVDRDGWTDLLVVSEWGPIRVFHNREGKLEDRTEQAGTAGLKGWWNGIDGSDLDGDGDMDFVVTNFGLNTKYHASSTKPASLYYGDVTGEDQWRLIEAEREGDKLFPIRGKSCSTLAMPHLGKKFCSYHEFAIAELDDIYSPKFLGEAHRFDATTLESGVLINDGSGRFSFKPLPRIAQISPSFGVVLTEVNGDGHPDLYLVQNFFTPQIETGSMDGGLSQLLLGKGDGHFEAVWPGESGLVVPGDAKSLVVTHIDDDPWPDFVVGVNNNRAQAFRHSGVGSDGAVRVRLVGDSGNPTSVGARVTLELSTGHRQTSEIRVGTGYLGQSSPILVFGVPSGQSVKSIEILWPDGTSSRKDDGDLADPIVIRRATQ